MGIKVRAIGSKNKRLEEYKKLDKKFIKQTRLVPADKFLFTIEMIVYGDRVAFIFFKEKPGIIIESQDVNNNMKAFFELAWVAAEE